MVRTAPVARRLGRAAGLPPETCYTLGLLHDLGKLIVFDRLTSLRTATRHTLRLPRAFLRDLLLRSHGPLGGLAALVWNLDTVAARAIAAHPRSGLRYQDEVMSEVLHVAEWWDLSSLKDGPRDYDALWAAARLTISVEKCRAALDDCA
jgi:HD-like signal output (HDOD) protein